MGTKKGRRVGRAVKKLDRVPADCGEERAQVGDGCERLRLRVVEGLKLKGNTVARFMVDQAMEGNMGALRLLIRVLDDPGGVPKKRVRRRSQAQRWAAEPEWQGEIEGGIWKDDGGDKKTGTRD
jgi:hypothetical protein